MGLFDSHYLVVGLFYFCFYYLICSFSLKGLACFPKFRISWFVLHSSLFLFMFAYHGLDNFTWCIRWFLSTFFVFLFLDLPVNLICFIEWFILSFLCVCFLIFLFSFFLSFLG